MKFNWKIAEKIGNGFGVNCGVNLNSNILQLIANRGIDDFEIGSFIDPDYNKLYDPFLFKDMDKAIDRVYFALSNNQKICIYGDYDADGVCSSALLFLFLKKLNADVFCYIPDRKSEGNGINLNAVEYINSCNTDLIISVDTGIVAFDEVDKINSLGMDVIITDHHSPIPEKFPNALSIINPKVNDCGYLFNDLAGVGVAFKFCVGLALKNKDKDDLLNFLKWNLDIVAIATVADMVSLVSENRTIVKYGLIVINKTKNIGLQELFKVCFDNKIPDEINVSDIGFRIGPRINAAGRMDKAMIAFDLLTTDDPIKARRIALELDTKNTERQNIVSSAVKSFIKDNSGAANDKIIIAHHDKWPVGVVGLIATKIRDHFNLPAFAMTTENNCIVGSGRSLNGFDITKAMQDNADLFVKFGGHELACGCSVSFEKYNEFVKTIKDYAKSKLDNVVFVNDLNIDMDICFNDINFDFYNDLLKLEPYGKGNDEPVFVSSNVEVIDFSVFGKNSEHFKMNLKQNGSIFSCFAFGAAAELFSKFKVGDRIDIVYKIVLNEWNGNRELRLNFVDYKNV